MIVLIFSPTPITPRNWREFASLNYWLRKDNIRQTMDISIAMRKASMKTIMSILLLAYSIACMQRRIPRAQGAPLSSVTIWNYVGEAIQVHCHDQFRNLVQQHVPHASDYVFTFYQNPDGTTLYSCSFVWWLNKTQEVPVWEGGRILATPKMHCGADTFKCLYKATRDGFYMAEPGAGHGVLSDWLLIYHWKLK